MIKGKMNQQRSHFQTHELGHSPLLQREPKSIYRCLTSRRDKLSSSFNNLALTNSAVISSALKAVERSVVEGSTVCGPPSSSTTTIFRDTLT